MEKRILIYTLISSFILFSSCKIEEIKTDKNYEKIDKLLDSYHDNFLLDGAVLISKGNEIIYEKGFGHASIEYNIPNKPDTKFRIASITKIFTVTMIMQLIDEGLIKLDDPIGKYLKKLRPDLGENVSVSELLRHKSGLERDYLPKDPQPGKEYKYQFKYPQAEEEFSTLDLVEMVNKNTKLIRQKDTISYSNASYELLGAIIENVTKQHYRDALKQRITEPLGMKNTGMEITEKAILPNLATGYRLRLGTYLNAKPVGMAWTRAGGGIYSTVIDLMLFNNALKGGMLLSKESFDSMFTKSKGVDYDSNSFAMQWQVYDSINGWPKTKNRYALARGASSTGYRNQWATEIEGEYSIFILTNLDYSPRREIAGKIFKILHEEEVIFPEKRLSLTAIEVLESEGYDKALEFLKQKKQGDEQAVGMVVNEMLELGFHRIRAQQPITSIDLFLLSDELYPNTPGILISLSFAYFEAGKMDEAKGLAKRVLKLSPKDSDAKRILEQIGD